MSTKSTKRKRGQDQPNLKRLREAVEQFAGDGEDKNISQGPRKFGVVRKQTRKEKRKELKLLKKAKKVAFHERKKIPTLEDWHREKEAALKEKLKKAKKREKNRRARERKRVKKAQEEEGESASEDEDTRIQGLRQANKQEDRAIKQLEKHLKMNKRKSKNLPKGFVDDGLDYLLDVVDSDKLKGFYDNSDEDEEKVGSAFEESDDSDGEEDEENQTDDIDDQSDEGSEENEKEIDEGSDEDDQDTDEGNDKDDKDTHDEGSDEEIDDAEDISDLQDTDDSDDEEELGSDADSDGITETSALTKKARTKKDLNSKLKIEKSESEILTKLKTKDEKKKKSVTWKDEGDDDDDDDDENVNSEDESIDDSEEYSNNSGDEHFVEKDTDDDNDRTRESKSKPDVWEDIYGRLRDKDGNIISKETVTKATYIPPAKRMQMLSDEGGDGKKKAELERLRKQLKGLINRLSENSLQPISSQIEDLYRTNSRAHMNNTLTSLILESCVSTVLTPERLSTEMALLLSILHCNVGTEVGATCIQTLAQELDRCLNGPEYGAGKEVDNILLLLGHLYNFKVFHSVLITDIIKRLSAKFGERDIELLLLILKNVGFTLRKDDPSGLKEIIVEIQQKANQASAEDFQDKSRVKFMLEVLLAVKNNNMRKIPNYDPTHVEHLKKIMRNYIRGTTPANSQLRISLHDLLNASERGRWWVVGSAWTGRGGEGEDLESKTSTSLEISDDVGTHILELARKQRMNTDVRKKIFCIIMTSEDFIDGFEKLLHLGLKHQQEREIVHVAMDCCVQESTYNPYYAYLIQKFCEFDRRFMMTFQFSLWDKFKQMSSLSQPSRYNLAHMLAHLIACKGVSLAILKVIEFAELDKAMVHFLRETLLGLLSKYDNNTIRDIFLRIAPVPKLQMLREGLKLFMEHFILRNKGKKTLTPITPEVSEKINLARQALSAAESSMKL